MAQPTVAMIGLGIMGSAMSGNLIRSRFQVFGYDVAPERLRALEQEGGSAARIAAQSSSPRCRRLIPCLKPRPACEPCPLLRRRFALQLQQSFGIPVGDFGHVLWTDGQHV
jgi:pyrroline-5-carboxylate reductase